MDGPPWLARSNHVCILSGDHAGGHDAGRQGRINDHSCVLASRRPWASGHVPTPCLGFRTFPFLIPLPLAVSIIMRSDFWTKKMNWVMSDLTSHFTPLCFCIDQVASFFNTFSVTPAVLSIHGMRSAFPLPQDLTDLLKTNVLVKKWLFHTVFAHETFDYQKITLFIMAIIVIITYSLLSRVRHISRCSYLFGLRHLC